MNFCFDRVESIVGKEANAGYMLSVNAFNLGKFKILLSCIELKENSLEKTNF